MSPIGTNSHRASALKFKAQERLERQGDVRELLDGQPHLRPLGAAALPYAAVVDLDAL